MESKLKDVVVGEIVAIKGKLNDVDYHFLVIKEKDCIAKLMITCRLLPVQDRTEESVLCIRDDS